MVKKLIFGKNGAISQEYKTVLAVEWHDQHLETIIRERVSTKPMTATRSSH